MNGSPSEKDRCPSFEDLSQFFDSGRADSKIAAHVEKCERCSASIKEFELMDSMLHRSVESVPVPDGLADRVKARIHDESNDEKLRKNSHRFRIIENITRFAAFFVLSGVLGYYVWQQYRPPEKETVEITEVIPDNASGVAVSSAKVPATMSSASKTAAAAPVDMAELTFVSPGSTMPHPAGTPAVNRRERIPAEIKPVVKHFWSAPAAAMPDIVKIAGETGITGVTASVKDGRTEFGFKTSGEKCIRFVRACHAAGLKLLSPEQPQPEQTVFQGTPSDIVDYSGVIMME